MPRPILPTTIHVTYSQQYRRCGKADCARCTAGGLGHGPYWYAYWREDGRMRSRYLGKEAPAACPAAIPVAGCLPVEAGPPSRVPPRVGAALRVRTLGGFAVWQGDDRIPDGCWTRRDVLALFTLLLGAPHYRVRRERVCDALWPEADPAAAVRHLHATLHLLRAALDAPDAPHSRVRLVGDVLALEPTAGAPPLSDWLDAAAFDQEARTALAGRDQVACRAALDRYGGDYLPDAPYTEWVVTRREELRARRRALLLHLARLSGAVGDMDEAAQCLRVALASDPCDEDAALALMGLLAGAGQRSAALRVYQALATALETNLGLAPGHEIEAARVRLLAQEAAPPMPARPPCAPQPTHPTNLPLSTTSFVGRIGEQRELAEVLSTTRLLTLTGPGGCGKTRLALEVAGAASAAFPDGVWLIELAGLGDATLVPWAVANALGVREQREQGLPATLCAVLGPRQVLLVLDNCEHLRDSCALMVTLLLRTCAGVRLLVTSRQTLGIRGETVWRVAGLAVPNEGMALDPAGLVPFDAVRLLVERARAVQPTFALTERNAAAVRRICRRLDGLPLALELAAARLEHLGVNDVAARLDDRFALLTGGSRLSLPRQQTLRATMEWSDRLLTTRERWLLRRLAVFAGGCTLEAAEAMCAAAGITGAEALDLLGGLIGQSLLGWEERDGTGRYRLLETVRQYAWEQLVADGDDAQARERHARYYLTLAEAAEQQWVGANHGHWLARMAAENDNLRAALHWARETGQGEIGLRIGAALGRFWHDQGHLTEACTAYAALLATGAGTPAVRAKALLAASVVAIERGDYTWGTTLCEESITLNQRMGNAPYVSAALTTLGIIAHRQGDPARGAALCAEGLALGRQVGDSWTTGYALNYLAFAVLDQGDAVRAEALCLESLALARMMGEMQGTAILLLTLGQVAHRQGDVRRAERWYRESLALHEEEGLTVNLAVCLEGLAAVVAVQGRVEEAAQFLGRATAARAAVGLFLPPASRAVIDAVVATTRAALGEEAFAAAWATGCVPATSRPSSDGCPGS